MKQQQLALLLNFVCNKEERAAADADMSTSAGPKPAALGLSASARRAATARARDDKSTGEAASFINT